MLHFILKVSKHFVIVAFSSKELWYYFFYVEGGLPFVCFLQRRFHAHKVLQLHSPCCSGHNGHTPATKRPLQWSHRESAHTYM